MRIVYLVHQNARTTVHKRDLRGVGYTERRPVTRIAAEFGVSVRTVYKRSGDFVRADVPYFRTAPARLRNREPLFRAIGGRSPGICTGSIV